MTEIMKIVGEELMVERAKIIRGECPECGLKISAKLDDRQSGDHPFDGQWHNVNCDACGYRADWIL